MALLRAQWSSQAGSLCQAHCTASSQRTQRPSQRLVVPVSAPPAHCGLRTVVAGGPLGDAQQNATGELHRRVQKAVTARIGSGGGRKGLVTMMPIGVPKVPYRTPGEGSWQWVDIWNVLYRERILFIGQAMDEEFGNQIIATMLYLDSLEAKPMVLYINSPGGEIAPALAIYDTMQSLKSTVGTVAFGYAWAVAGFLLACGEKGRRSVLPNTRMMLQPPSGAARGRASDIQNEANELLRMRAYMNSVLAEKTDKPVEKVEKDLARLRYFNAQEAIDYGLIDRVIRPRRMRMTRS